MSPPTASRSSRRLRAAAVLALLVLAGGGSASGQGADRLPPEVARLDTYLDRLGLASLRIRHLERELERSRQGHSAPGIASQLSEVYADRLLTVTDPKEEAELAGRLTRLIHDHPSAGSPRVRLTLLEGDYNRAEDLALKWIADPADQAARTDALARLGRCRPELDRAREELLKRVEDIDKELDRSGASPRFDALEREYRAASQTASRATYFAAWANTYEGLLSADSPGERFRVARRGFLSLLGVEEEGIKGADIEGLEVETTARIALGLAVADLAGAGREEGKDVFRTLRDPKVHPTVRDWVDRWEVWTLLRAGEDAEAETTARTAVDRLAPPFSPARGALCSVLIRGVRPPPGTAGHTAAPADRERADRLVGLGLRGLIRLGRPDLARQLLGDRDLSASAPPGAMAHWLRGQAALHAAEVGHKAEMYGQAQAAFAAAQAAPDAESEPTLIVDCRFGQAWCLFRLGELATARDAFRQVAEAQKARGLPTADAEWMAMMADWSLADDPPDRRLERIATEARAFRERHPEHEGAVRVDEVVARLRRELASPQDVKRGATDDPAVLLVEARELHRRWVALPAGERSASPLTASLAALVRDALARIGADADPAGRLDVLLIEADLALAASPPDGARARPALVEAARLAAKLPPGDPRIAEERFRRFQLARADADASAIREHARWLVDHPGAAGHERAGLSALAEQADEAYRAAGAGDRPARAAEALEIHQRLASILADFPDRVRSNPTLRLVYMRMARYALDADQPQAAVRFTGVLRLARPDDPKVLRLAGLAHDRSGQFEPALACWRKLVEDLPHDSPDWFEARFHQIECLAHIDPPRARRVWEQFRVLHPELGPDPWPARFRELGDRFP